MISTEATWMKIYELSKQLVKANVGLHHLDTFSPLIRVMEFNTIRLGSGRQNGKTEFIFELADENTLVLLPENYLHVSIDFKAYIKPGVCLALIADDLKRLKSPSNFAWLSTAQLSTIPINPKFKRVIIDDAHLAPNSRKIMRKLIELEMVTEDVEYVLVN